MRQKHTKAQLLKLADLIMTDKPRDEIVWGWVKRNPKIKAKSRKERRKIACIKKKTRVLK